MMRELYFSIGLRRPGMKKEIADALKTHKELIAQFEKAGVDIVTKAAEMLIETFKKGGRVYLCGNGGSAADCQHIAGELINRFKRDRKALPAVALSTDTSVITSIANDYSYEDTFARQVEGLVTQNDVLWAFSTSGSSANVLAAAKLAKEKGAQVLAFTGKADTPLERISDLCLGIDAPSTSSAQEVHQLAYHMICDLVEAAMFKD
jgi:D-sedoheptulose 7-phosphate isomerase